MNKALKIILLGVLIWIVPFIVSMFIWDVEAGMPIVSAYWFGTIMAVCWAVAFAIAICVYFRSKLKDPVRDGWIVGISWFIVLLILDLIVLVAAFGMDIADYLRMFINYLATLIITVAVGYVKAAK